MFKILTILIISVSSMAQKKYTAQNYVICSFPKTHLLDFISKGEYSPPSLEGEGFIHCCKSNQLSYVMEKFFVEAEQVLLISSKEKLGVDLIYENGDFPHLYRSFKASDLVDIFLLSRQEDGSFKLPKELE